MATQPSGQFAAALSFVRRRWWALGLGAIGLVVLGIILLVATVGQVPIPDHVPGPQASKLLAADGTLVGTLHGVENRTIVPLSEIAPDFQHAVVSAEDRNFYNEGGVSVRGTLRALFADVQAGGAAQGGSTITQQYVRNAFPEVGRSKSIFRKLKEVVLAVKLGHRYPKDKVLEFYLNTVYFGRGAYGAETAAHAYFGKSAKDLTLPESAFLAGIIRSPENYQPQTNPAGVVRIQKVVLDNLVRDAKITPEQAAAAASQPLDFSHGVTGPTSARAAYFIEYVRRFLKDQAKLSDQDILTGGLTINTTLDLKMQDAAEAAISSTLNNANDPEAALVAMDNGGNVRAMVGGRQVTSTARAQGFNVAYQRSGNTGGRQAGSAFKPFTLASFVQEGYTINTQYPGPPKLQITSPQCRNLDGTPWSVSNFNNESFPSLDVTEATAHSVNTIYAQMIDQLTPKKVTAMAENVGGWSNLPQVCSITLGVAPVTPLEMARAYTTFAARGQRPDPLAVTKVTAPDGRVIFETAPHTTKELDPNVADTVNKVLTSVLDHGTAAGKGIGRPAAGKTGTTENQVDAWFVGYTPNLTAAVWMGFPPDPATGQTPAMTNVRGGPVTGGSFPATMWQKFMTAAVAGTPVSNFVQPTIGGKNPGASNGCSAQSTPCPPPPSVFNSPARICGPGGPAFDPGCVVAPSPSPAPTPSFSPLPAPSPTFVFSPLPSPSPRPSPSPSPIRSPSPLPSPSPNPSPRPSPSTRASP